MLPFEMHPLWDRAANRFLLNLAAQPIRVLVRDALGDALSTLPDRARVLDLDSLHACVPSTISALRTDLELVSVSSQRARAQAASSALARRQSTAQALYAPLDALPFDDASFDAVVSIGGMRRWTLQQKTLLEACRVLRTDGPLLVADFDRSCRHRDAQGFVACWRLPALMRPVALMVFRTWLAGLSCDLDDVRERFGVLPLREVRVERMAATPAWRATGMRSKDAVRLRVFQG